jgi:hypothetical protein
VLTVTSPLWFPVAFVFLATEVAFVLGEWMLRRRMRRAGRYLHRRALAGRGGTLICDSPSFGWGVARLWWTPDDVLADAPAPPEAREERSRALRGGDYQWHAFDRWVSERYVSPETGTAYLCGVWHAGRATAEKLRARYPGVAVVESWSGGAGAEELMTSMNDRKDVVRLRPMLRPDGDE